MAVVWDQCIHSTGQQLQEDGEEARNIVSGKKLEQLKVDIGKLEEELSITDECIEKNEVSLPNSFLLNNACLN